MAAEKLLLLGGFLFGDGDGDGNGGGNGNGDVEKKKKAETITFVTRLLSPTCRQRFYGRAALPK